MIRELTDLLMPRTCLTCGRQLGAQEKHLCIWCRSDMPLTWNWEQPHNPMADELNALLTTIRNQGDEIEMKDKEITRLKARLEKLEPKEAKKPAAKKPAAKKAAAKKAAPAKKAADKE